MPRTGPNTKALSESFFAGGVGMKQQLFVLLLYCCVLLRLFAHINNNIAINGIVLLLIRKWKVIMRVWTHTHGDTYTHKYTATMLAC